MVKYLDNNSGFNQWAANKDAQKPGLRLSRILWWMVLIMAAWWIVGLFISPRPQNTMTETSAEVAMVDLGTLPAYQIDSDKITATVRGLAVSDVALKDFHRDTDGDDLMTLLDETDGAFAEVGMLATGTTAPVMTTAWRVGDNGEYSWRNSDGVEFVRNISTDGYVINVTDTVRNKTKHDISVAPYARIVRGADEKSSAGVFTGSVAFANSDFEHKSWSSIEKHPRAYTSTNGYVGFVDQYWETVVSIDSANQTMRAAPHGKLYQADAAAGAVSIAPGADATITTHLYVGPREKNALQSAATVIPGIAKTMDYGWFWFLARPMLWALNLIHAFVMNYGVAIIILTILLRILMWPLTRKSYQSMAKMQKMQPEMQRIQKLYANDKARLQLEMMKLYQTHRTSPMSGCLPLLIQIPIFFALYKALLISVQMRHAHFLWINDLAAMDPYFILPILMGATMWWQQAIQSTSNAGKSADDPIAQTQRAMKWMPVLFTILFAWMPAGLVLYWATSNLCGILQMYVIKKRS